MLSAFRTHLIALRFGYTPYSRQQRGLARVSDAVVDICFDIFFPPEALEGLTSDMGKRQAVFGPCCGGEVGLLMQISGEMPKNNGSRLVAWRKRRTRWETVLAKLLAKTAQTKRPAFSVGPVVELFFVSGRMP